jgi:ABC-type transport system involved in multi-copper enzyme maturation permease subunit
MFVLSHAFRRKDCLMGKLTFQELMLLILVLAMIVITIAVGHIAGWW